MKANKKSEQHNQSMGLLYATFAIKKNSLSLEFELWVTKLRVLSQLNAIPMM